MIQFLLSGYAILSEQMVIIIGVLALVLFGGAKIPQLMRGLGRGMGEFHAGVAEGKTIMQNTLKAEPAQDAKGAEPSKEAEEAEAPKR